MTRAKFARQRIVLLDTTACRAITEYLHRPDRHRAGLAPESTVLTTGKGTKVPQSNARGAFHAMTQHAGLTPRAGARPRPHDLRHTFAARTMIEAYRCGREPARTLTLLAVMITVRYLSPWRVCRQTCSSTPITRTPSKRASSSISRRWPSARTALFAVCDATPSPAATRDTVR